jgi:ankyrin repeat protein
LKFAIGARQVDMVDFLLASGAKPSEPDSWSTLAGQLMNRSWLTKTMADIEKQFVADRIIAIMSLLLKHGWDVNSPFEASGKTVLHQAVTFWTGSYMWDLNLRTAITSFLCVHGADSFRADVEGKSPYDMALASGHQDILVLLNRDVRKQQLHDGRALPAELSS